MNDRVVAAQLAERIGAGQHPVAGRAMPSLGSVADRFFLDTLQRHPLRLEALLAALFLGVSGDAALGFLDDTATAAEQLAVAAAMPQWLRWALLDGESAEKTQRGR